MPGEREKGERLLLCQRCVRLSLCESEIEVLIFHLLSLKAQMLALTGTHAYDAIVIGGGVCGLTAAASLEARGLRVLLLEGRARLGGRVVASPTSGVDLGAQWVHGAQSGPGGVNPLAALAKRAHLRLSRCNYDNAQLYDARGAVSDARESAVEGAWRRVSRAAARRAEASLGARVDAAIATCGLSGGRGEADARHGVATEVEHEFGADAAWLCARHYDEGADVKGGDWVFPGHGGLAAIVPVLRADLTTTRVLEGARVDRIEYSASGVHVTVADGGGVHSARAALVTVPLGVLQASVGARGFLPPVAGAARIAFHPPLPQAHAAAISALGMGVLNKCIVRFAASVELPRTFDMLEFVGDAPSAAVGSRPFPEFLVLRDANVLLAFCAGSEAVALSAADDATVRGALMAQLRAMLGAALPEPLSFERTQWDRDPFSCGSYSFLPPGASATTRAALAAPVLDGVLVLAGEHTRTDFPSTVHGAMLAGAAAADALGAKLRA